MISEQADRAGTLVHATWLGGGVALLAWDYPAGGRVRPAAFVCGEAVGAPAAALRVEAPWGQERQFLAFRWPSERLSEPAELRGADGRVLAIAEPPADSAAGGDLSGAIEGLSPASRCRLARFVLETCRTTFRLGEAAAFGRACRQLAEQLAPAPGFFLPRAIAGEDLLLCEVVLPRDRWQGASGIWLGDRGVRAAKFAPGRRPGPAKGGVPMLFMAERGRAEAGDLLVLLSPEGVAMRTMRKVAAVPSTLEWLSRNAAQQQPVRDYLRELGEAGIKDSRLDALVREIDAFMPPAHRALSDPAKPVGGDVDLCLEHGDGVFVAGWLRDPADLVGGVRLRLGAHAADVTSRMHRFPRTDVDKHFHASPFAGGHALHGFALDMPLPASAAQAGAVRLELVLRSGATLELSPRPRLMAPALGRDAVLSAAPFDWLTAEALRTCVAPAARALHMRHLATRLPPRVDSLGAPPTRPKATVIVPLYRNLGFLHVQYAAFASDPAFSSMDLVYVLDSPEQMPEVELRLRNLFAVFGLPVRLVTMSANFGFAAANNAGAAVARADTLVLVNSDVIPEGPGWIDPLLAALGGRVGAAGARLLFDDQSLQHAGVYFAPDERGDWRNRHYFKGFPREYPLAARGRNVPAATAACLAVPRAVYERAGGLAEDYIVGDYEDTDFCLRLRESGLDIRYVPEATLLHFERQSMPLNAGGARATASECNRLLHAERWQGAMEALMARPEFAPDRPNPAPADERSASSSRTRRERPAGRKASPRQRRGARTPAAHAGPEAS